MKKQILCFLILAFFLLPTIGVSATDTRLSPTQFDANDSSWVTDVLVQINTSRGTPVLPRNVEVVGGNPGKWIDVILPETSLTELSNEHLSYTVLIEDVDTYMQSFAGQYHTLAEINQILQDTAAAYPSITRLFSLGTSYEGRTIWCLDITDNPGVDEGEPGVVFMGVHHAREWPGAEIVLNIIKQLTTQYNSNPQITNLVNNRRVFLVPCVNVDGYYYSHDLGHDWRKNRHYFPEYGTTGVDLNRNYDGTCNGNPWGAWGSVGSSSVGHNPYDEVYCGPAAASELEVQAVRNLFIQYDIQASISWHTFSELVLWPWGYLLTQHTPDATYMSQIGHGIASRITQQDGSGTYTPEQSAALYPTTGDSDDWIYGYSHYVQGKSTFAFTIEACQDFEPPAGALDQIVSENYDGALYLLQEAQNISANTVPRVLPPHINLLPDDPDGNYQVSWEQQNPNAVPDAFQLDELTVLKQETDTAETGSLLWNLDGFAISSDRSHSASNSFLSRKKDSDVSAMTTRYPLPVTSGMNLSFWCWYATENQFDYGFVEVSRDNRTYDILDMFTGSSTDWIHKQYDLSSYAGTSIFIRFRYTTDERTTGEGFYVDDIAPVPNFKSVKTLSNTITGNSYDITGRTNETYYYRVRGHNQARGWCDFSTLQMVKVGTGKDMIPPIGKIQSPKPGYLYLKNRQIMPFFTTLLIGETTIDVNATDVSGIDRVEFYLDGKIVATDTTAPYNWTWNNFAFFRHTLKVVAVDNYDNSATNEMTIWKFF